MGKTSANFRDMATALCMYRLSSMIDEDGRLTGEVNK